MNALSKHVSYKFNCVSKNISSGEVAVCSALIMRYQSHARSKYVTLKAKEVVGHNPKRARNSRVFVNPGIYSWAVDAFLEVSTHLYSH